MNIFRLAPLSAGPNPLYWDTLQSLIGEADIPIQPDANYRPFLESASNMAGHRVGRGFAVATWGLQGTTPAQRYTLRQICPGLSADVYFETTTNEFDASGNRIWIQAQSIMNWTDGEEDIQSDKTLDIEIVFTHIIEI